MHFMGPTKNAVLDMLRGPSPEQHVPIMLGRYEVQAKILLQDRRWILLQMRINEEKADAEGKRRMAAGEPWMPEMRGMFLEPDEVLASADSAAALADLIAGRRYRFFA